MRYQMIVPMSVVNAPSGASIHVYSKGAVNHTPQTLFADGTSAATLANPYAHPGGKVVFYLAQQEDIQVGVQPAGAPAPVITSVIPPGVRVRGYQVRKAAGQPVDWVLS